MSVARPVERPALTWLWVGLGSMVGGLLRWQLSVLFLPQVAGGLAWGTLIVNILGSFIIGFYAAAAPGGSPYGRQFVMAGFCGGFTTFSLFSLENLLYLRRGQELIAALNISLSVITWLLAVWLGFRAAAALTGGAGDARS